MRICILTTRHDAADDRIFYKQARTLAKAFDDITILAPESTLPAPSDSGKIQFRFLRPVIGPIGRMSRLIQAVREVRLLAPDVCHFHDPDVLAILPWLRRACTLSPIYDAHEAYPEAVMCSRKIPDVMRPLSGRCADYLEKRIARQCSLVVTADNATAADFQRCRIPALTLFNYPPLSFVAPDPPLEHDIACRYRDRAIAIYHGSMAEERGLFQMLKATSLVRAKIRSFLLVLVGLRDGELKRRAVEEIRTLQVEPHVELISHVPHTEVAAYLRMARVGLAPLQPIPKYYKNIPLKIFEYMACGLPIVGANLPTIAPFVTESGAGVVADCTRPAAIADAIVRLLQNDRERAEMSQSGRRAFLTRYNWEAMEPLLLDAYRTLAASPLQQRRLI